MIISSVSCEKHCLTLSRRELELYGTVWPLYDDRKLPSRLNENICTFIDECVIHDTIDIDEFFVQILKISFVIHC